MIFDVLRTGPTSRYLASLVARDHRRAIDELRAQGHRISEVNGEYVYRGRYEQLEMFA